MDVSMSAKQVKKVPKTQGFSKKLEESIVVNTEEDVNTSNLKQNSSEQERVLNAFNFFDVNKKGFITCREYFSILLGTKQFTEEEIQKIIESSNLDIKGVIDYNKFYEFWKNK